MAATKSFSNNKLDTLGVFSWDPGNLGDPYGRARTVESRIRGKQFTTSPTKKGHGPDATFTRFVSIHAGDAFTTPEQRRRQYEKEKKAKQLTPVPFKPSSPTKRQSGHGTHTFGVFQTFPYMKTSDDYDKRSTGRQPLAPKNFYTSPPKKGSYGMYGMNIGGKVDGVCGEFSYVAAPPTSKPRHEQFRPFTPSSPPKKGTYGFVGLNLGGTSTGANGEFSYESDGLFNRPRTTQSPQPAKPFIPSSPAKNGTGVDVYVGKYPEHQVDPFEAKTELERSKRKEHQSLIHGGVFRPAGVPKSIRQPSIMLMKANQHHSM
mmetsp:Transcript_73438/g.153307  ORF Transcript_73438/g.153307 Transcript_73438/m.153307 type:complete len:317 (-) Transcript_73438:331-1281(-)|eukprot:CAMPEP_0181297418 /NCGR_PEP_ID=MMETSP1101-20121128/5228_1 /TAXON_ID=46948 /ORGANISM="Rhodomonas abbreviata, Strain Caron Lab Isolate" /LENGTH=316 /DNA_ID=CAMNT_0023402351 /DNA_START=118 /DNA_END=1068 /DNA_ORIENTATION=-